MHLKACVCALPSGTLSLASRSTPWARVRYNNQTQPIVYYGTVTRIGRMAGVIWVQWDNLRNPRPVQPSLLVPNEVEIPSLWGTF